MRKEDCKVGLEVIVNYPGNYMDSCTGNVVEMKADKVSVAIQCFGGKVWDFAYSNIEPYGADKFNEGDSVMICKSYHEANGCIGTIVKKLLDQAVVEIDYGNEVVSYYIEYGSLRHAGNQREQVESQHESKVGSK